MKRQMNLTVILILFMSIACAKAFAYDIVVKNNEGFSIYYNYIGDGSCLEVAQSPQTDKYAGDIIIPETVTFSNKVRTVTSIGENAFLDCSGLTSVVIPQSVTAIGTKAFNNCSWLTSVSIPNSVVSIGDYAFTGSWRLASVEFPSSMTSIPKGAFCNCSSLSSFEIPNTVISICDEAFSGCVGLTSISIPESVSSIGTNAFYQCSGLTSVHITDLEAWCKITYTTSYKSAQNSNPLSYAHHLFLNDTEIQDLVIPNNVTSINRNAFHGCLGLKSVTIPSGVTTIGDYAFYHCDSIKSLSIANSVTSIGDLAFCWCMEISSLNLPNSVTSIGESAFAQCHSLTSLDIPNSITTISKEAFYWCWNLTSINIPSSVTSIGESAFERCQRLTSVTIPSSITSIGDKAFQFCSSLTSVYSLIENPFKISYRAFSTQAYPNDFSNNATLYVPTGTSERYKETEGWKDFSSIEEKRMKTCDKPTISYANGKLVFNCNTEDVTFHSTITDSDIASYVDNEVELGLTYIISVYASKEGYDNSEISVATLCWIDQEPKTEGTINGVAQIEASPVLIQNRGGQIFVTGVKDGTKISTYTISGKQIASTDSFNGQAIMNTNLSAGSVAIVKVGEKSMKIFIK